MMLAEFSKSPYIAIKQTVVFGKFRHVKFNGLQQNNIICFRAAVVYRKM